MFNHARTGIQAPPITIKVRLIRGLPEAVIRKSKDCVHGAIMNNHYEFPIKRITINPAPVRLPNERVRFDTATHINSNISTLGLVARTIYRILKVAPTIADLAIGHVIETPHFSEATAYRCLKCSA